MRAYLHIYIYICMIFFVHSCVCVHEASRSNKPLVQTCVCVCVCVCVYVYVCVCVFCAWVLQCYTVCVCVCVNHISTINHESSNSSWWLSAQSSVTHTTNQNQNKRKLPVWLCTGFSLGYIAPAINYIISGCAICQNYMFSGESNMLQHAATHCTTLHHTATHCNTPLLQKSPIKETVFCKRNL